ncbi:calcium-dependent protein kinase, putative [Phytophthora infestans T30-4]|uniref:Calcium-dependent protein kinase, putative n=1 Tax=Phytophthora infestans (strain T30-4) TaxID=403677 RepID=D0NQW3_PHYIT|nr:calcium-dependent protein kinase, putative [Phytophthora infestans T30-4]EEY63061.1 calcium-dependent protein kinase, putative [Phytophthora infestans T30-4]|eukprot:XP_002898584.1 calcium-dependent protein kinase, putative [Phytophthora infestans T30-4]
MKAIPSTLRRSTRLNRARFIMTIPDQYSPHQQADAAMTPGASTFVNSRRQSSASRKPLGLHYGSIRRSWRGYLDKLAPFPWLQHVALEAASFFTKPEELEFNLPRNFHGKYTLGDKLGEGAFGQVYCVLPIKQEARGCELQLDLAVKIVPKSRVVSRKDYAALKQEGRMMVLLGGTLNVVHFFGAYEDDTNVYLVMERCVGGDASSRLSGEKELDLTANPKQEERAKMYMRDILHVVWQCHLLRILHRDLKLENFLFADTKDDSPLKLTDFGGAAFLDEGQFLHDVHGTPLYTAPEVLKHKYAFPSDLWSCGVILYRLLSGRFPFESGPLLDERIQHEEIDLESPPWTGISDEAKELVSQLLERDVTKRLTAEQALKHPWLAPSAPLSAEALTTASAAAKEATKGISGPALNGTLVQRLQLYRSLNSLQRAVLNEVTRLLPLALKQDALVLFSEVSRDGSERVGLEEFAAYVAAGGYRLTRGEAKGFLRNLDLDGNGLLSRDEFCAALLDWPQLQSQQADEFVECANQVFDMVDEDRDGLLTLEDVAELTPFQESGKHLHSFRNDLDRCFQYTDRSGRGCIDKDDFKHMLRIPAGAYAHFPRRIRF